MRLWHFAVVSSALLLASAGCVPQLAPDDGSLIPTGEEAKPDGTQTSVDDANAADGPATAHETIIDGAVYGAGNYQLFDLTSANAGEEWTFRLNSTSALSGFTVVLFDENMDLLMRERVTRSTAVSHILRADATATMLGVMPYYTTEGGTFEFSFVRGSGSYVPARQQVVYLNFAGSDGVSIHRRDPIAFPPLAAENVNPDYTGLTDVMRDAIVATMLEDYAAYDVVIMSSEDGPPPNGVECTTIHFGGTDSGLLGLADSVDMYNEDLAEAAIVYVDSFAPYKTMRLTADEMGVMIGNVASHELGHLLGLYHTKDPQEVMDSTGSAWDLAGEQTFHRGPLEDTVFPTGMENTPRLLEQTVGFSEGDKLSAAKVLDQAKALRYKQLRNFMKQEISIRCGHCLNPDD